MILRFKKIHHQIQNMVQIFSSERYETQEEGSQTQNMARSEGFEPPTPWFEAKYSIQLSYERNLLLLKKMVGRIGFEPMTQRLKASCSTN